MKKNRTSCSVLTDLSPVWVRAAATLRSTSIRPTLYALEFLRRFVQHVLPKGFRHYGLLANARTGWAGSLYLFAVGPSAPHVHALPLTAPAW